MTTPKLFFVYGISIGVVIGGVAGALITKRRYKKRYSDLADEEIKSVKEHYKKRYKEEGYSTPEEAVKTTYGETIDDIGYATPATSPNTEENPPTELRTVDEETPDHIQYQGGSDDGVIIVGERKFFEFTPEEYGMLTPEQIKALHEEPHEEGEPYVISEDAFMDDEPDHEKITLTYFQEDNVLMDDREDTVPDVAYTVGVGSLNKFGQMTRDPSCVYVRNEKLDSDFEITKDERSYAEVVLGYRPGKAGS